MVIELVDSLQGQKDRQVDALSIMNLKLTFFQQPRMTNSKDHFWTV